MNDIILPLLVIFILFMLYTEPNPHKLQKEAVEKGYALYCPDTGDWAWVGECDKDEP